ncbi:hypothetical protein KSF_048470 [Reticulibacter mediterranei]|uniref:Uncharacterized protein n=1 Tax=Reticulibacter mediterranei TaxID=2778369 RepID=A0A8J3IG26_9CHLR|nr:hypothetical protein [Reticulibacter mediterranei]GHO94799.1 hypothetical protein KSF_048470 [Reticulibacter mediterranei]
MSMQQLPSIRTLSKAFANPERAFTHADLVAFFQTSFGTYQDPSYELLKVSLLPEIAVPATWQVDYRAIYPGAQPRHFSTLIIQKEGYDGKPYLNITMPEEVPSGFSMPQEEDAEMERREVDVLKKWKEQRARKQEEDATAPPDEPAE